MAESGVERRRAGARLAVERTGGGWAGRRAVDRHRVAASEAANTDRRKRSVAGRR